MSEQREALAEALSQHAWLSSDEQKIGDEWIWGLNCECGEFIPDAEANAHLAGALLASPALARLLADAERGGTHPVLTHPSGDKCIWLDDVGWFVPLDAGGEGYACEQEHPWEAKAEQRGADRVAAAVEAKVGWLESSTYLANGAYYAGFVSGVDHATSHIRAALTPGAADRGRAEEGDRGCL